MTQSATANVLRVQVYGDITCPWCWIQGNRFASAVAELGNDVTVHKVHRPFQLDPDGSEQPMPLPQLLSKKYSADAVAQMSAQLSALGKQEGLTFNFEAALVVNTFKAHQVLWLAGRDHSPTVQAALVKLLYEAYFQNGLNVADHDVLASLAAQAGMDGARVKQAVEAGEGRDEVHAELKAARARGIRAVPAIVFSGGESVSGAQDVSFMVNLLRRQIASGASNASKN